MPLPPGPSIPRRRTVHNRLQGVSARQTGILGCRADAWSFSNRLQRLGQRSAGSNRRRLRGQEHDAQTGKKSSGNTRQQNVSPAGTKGMVADLRSVQPGQDTGSRPRTRLFSSVIRLSPRIEMMLFRNIAPARFFPRNTRCFRKNICISQGVTEI